MWMARVSLSSRRRAASEVDLPLPVPPVTRMSPFFSEVIFLKASGSFRSLIVAMTVSSLRRMME